jgi:hypothetical protein
VGMDDFSIITTCPYTPNLPISMPDTTGSQITHIHQGTRKHLHKLWRAIACHQAGQNSYTYQSLIAPHPQKRSTHLKTTQMGYQVKPRTRPKPTTHSQTQRPNITTVTTSSQPPTDQPSQWHTKHIRLIHNLRAGLWNVRTTTSIPSQNNSEPVFRYCDHCDTMATLHHILCTCTHPEILATRQKIVDDLPASTKMHSMHHLFCQKEHLHWKILPTSLANTRWTSPAAPPTLPPTQTLEPTCLYLWLGLAFPTSTAQKNKTKHTMQAHHHLMQGTCQLVHTWMQLSQINTTHTPLSALTEQTKPQLHSQPPKIQTRHRPRLTPNRWSALETTCQHHSNCQNKTTSAYQLCRRHQTPSMKTRLKRHQPPQHITPYTRKQQRSQNTLPPQFPINILPRYLGNPLSSQPSHINTPSPQRPKRPHPNPNSPTPKRPCPPSANPDESTSPHPLHTTLQHSQPAPTPLIIPAASTHASSHNATSSDIPLWTLASEIPPPLLVDEEAPPTPTRKRTRQSKTPPPRHYRGRLPDPPTPVWTKWKALQESHPDHPPRTRSPPPRPPANLSKVTSIRNALQLANGPVARINSHIPYPPPSYFQPPLQHPHTAPTFTGPHKRPSDHPLQSTAKIPKVGGGWDPSPYTRAPI